MKYEHDNDTDDIPEPDITHPVRMNIAQQKGKYEHENDTDDIPDPDIAHPIRNYHWTAQKESNGNRKADTYPAKDSHSKILPYVVRDHAWNHD